MTKNQCEEVFAGRINTPYHHEGAFAKERAEYLAHLLERGWARATVIGTACKLVAFAARVNIAAKSGVTAAQIESAADDWMKQPRHYFRRDIGPRKARTKFVSDATNWHERGQFKPQVNTLVDIWVVSQLNSSLCNLCVLCACSVKDRGQSGH